jgi:hypothetical protein
VYTVAAFGVTYVTIGEIALDSGGGTTTVINVDVVSPNGPLSVQFEGGSFTIKLDNSQYVAIDNYIKQQLIAPILVHNNTSIDEPILVNLDEVAYGTKAVEIPRGEYKTISLSNFDQADANHTVTAVVGGKQSATTYVNVWRKDPARSYDEHVNAVRITDELFDGSVFADRNITYHITPNGGLDFPYSPYRQTTELTFTFSSELKYTPKIEKVSGDSAFGPLTPTDDPRTFTMSVFGNPGSSTAIFQTTSPGIDPGEHTVVIAQTYSPGSVYIDSTEHNTTYHIHSFTVQYTTDQEYTMTYKEGKWNYSSASGPIADLKEFKKVAALPRNVEHTIHYSWEIEEVTWNNGVGTRGTFHQLGQYGYFIRDHFTGVNYVDLALNPGVGKGYKFKVGNKTIPAYAYDNGSGPWPFKIAVAFAHISPDIISSYPNTRIDYIRSGMEPNQVRIPVLINHGSNRIGTSTLTDKTGLGSPLLGLDLKWMDPTYFSIHGIGVSTGISITGFQFDLWVQQ